MLRRRSIWLLASLLLLAIAWHYPRRFLPSFLLSSPGPAAKASNFTRESQMDTTPLLHISNSDRTLAELVRSERAILLENATIDTASSRPLPIPRFLQATGDPGAFVVQARQPLSDRFRLMLKTHGASVVAYIPNQACLVRCSQGQAAKLEREPSVQAVAAFEPYYKLKTAALALAFTAEPGGPAPTQVIAVKALLFPDVPTSAGSDLQGFSTVPITTEASPFGPVLNLVTFGRDLARLAARTEVQEIELTRERRPANDLARVSSGVALTSRTATNYLGLTGTNVLVCLADTGVDETHPDLWGRVLPQVAQGGFDTNGHGTVVAGVVAGNGAQSATVLSAPGSCLPAAAGQFRGAAPQARIFSLPLNDPEAARSDPALQQMAAQTNAFISNNSWVHQGSFDYDLSAASYDAAVRDALPGIPGSQPVLFVFAAGNAGSGSDEGAGGLADSIQSPATAKNVITVGALEEYRRITNQTWNCSTGSCQTNQPWFSLTDSSNRVAAFSGRGNVGIGVEGVAGRFKPDLVAPGAFLVSTRSAQWNSSAFYSPSNAFNYNHDTNYFGALSGLDSALGPYYRFETGTSLAAGQVSGALALMQEFFAQRLGVQPSPALFKALVINGARSLGAAYAYQPAGGTNFQGWGQLQLPASLPPTLTNRFASTNGIFAFDQSPTNALVTGQALNRLLALSPSARTQALRITLTWTDPPANPAAAIKLVNDLDLLVTNLDTGQVFLGNTFGPGSIYSLPLNADPAAKPDCLNNVECIYLEPPLATNYAVSVLGSHVNVNALPSQSGVAQDFALVIRSGDGTTPNAMAIANPVQTAAPTGPPTELTNQFNLVSGRFGQILSRQRIGAHAPVNAAITELWPGDTNHWLTLGTSNQWRFYVITNELGFPNAAFATYSPPPLAASQMALTYPPGVAKPGPESDIDLYVSTDSALLSLDPAALALADKSVSRTGTETIVLSNALPVAYYIAVKCESPLGAEFGFAGLFSQQPFYQVDLEGNRILQCFPSPAPIAAGDPSLPAETIMLAIAPESFPLRRVAVSNLLDHPQPADLRISIYHRSAESVLSDHSAGLVSGTAIVFDDALDADPGTTARSTGPGSLRQFGGSDALGAWVTILTSTNLPGTNVESAILLEPEPDLASGILTTIPSGAAREYFLTVPPSVTNCTWQASLLSGTGPGLLSARTGIAGETAATLELFFCPSNRLLSLDANTYPSLLPGRYVGLLSNPGPDAISVFLQASLAADPGPRKTHLVSTAPVSLLDDGITTASLLNTNPGTLEQVEVSARVDHPRVSDLVLTLVSPSGSRVELCANRGGSSTAGLGIDVLTTNFTPVSSSGGPEAATNFVDTGQTSGTVTINYDFYDLPDRMDVYYEGVNLFSSGLVSGSNSVTLSYGPGSSTLLAVVMNQGGSTETNTVWQYTVTSTRMAPVALSFTENTDLAALPIKFALPPFTNFTQVFPTLAMFYLPEQSLLALAREPAAGPWSLEILDSRSGAINPAPTLLSWSLDLLIHPPDAPPTVTTLSNARPLLVSGSSPNHFRFTVSTNAARAQFEVLNPSADVTLFARFGLPVPNPNAYDLLSANPWTNDEWLLIFTNAGPVQLLPGDWFLTVDPGPTPAAYTVLATEWPESGTNLLITDQQIYGNTVCLTWQALPGARYFLEASPDNATGWVAISPSITASNTTASLCVPFPAGSQFFAVREGLVLFAPVQISTIASNPAGVLLTWPANSPLDLTYKIEWSPSLSPASWSLFTNRVHAISGECSFLDDGSQTAGPAQTRYYRVIQLPFGQ